MAKSPEPRPDFPHRLGIDRLKCVERFDVKIKRAGVAALGAIVSFVSEKDRTGDDASAILEKHNRARSRVQAGGDIAKAAIVCGQKTAKAPLLHVLDAPATEAFNFVAHREDSYCGNIARHVNRPAARRERNVRH